MRPLLDWFRWKLFDYLQWQFPPEQPSEEELIAYGKEQERHSLPELPIAETQQHTGPIAPIEQPILGIRQRAHLRTRREFTAPIRRVELLPDDTWLIREQHTGPFDLDALERQTEPTLHVPAVRMRDLHPRR